MKMRWWLVPFFHKGKPLKAWKAWKATTFNAKCETVTTAASFILAGGPDDALDRNEIMGDGEPRWRAWVERAVSAILAHRNLTE